MANLIASNYPNKTSKILKQMKFIAAKVVAFLEKNEVVDWVERVLNLEVEIKLFN